MTLLIIVFAVFAIGGMFGNMRLARHLMQTTEKLNSLREENKRMENALADIVKTFSENGINMHRNQYQKLMSISRGRMALPKPVSEQ